MVVTVSLLLSVLVLYGFGIVKVTAGLARGIIAAVGAIALLYLFGWIMWLFGVDVVFWDSASNVGCGSASSSSGLPPSA